MVLVVIPLTPQTITEADLALTVAAKVLKLPRMLADTVLENRGDFEHRFRTASGRVAVVTIAHDRRSAVVRLLPLDGAHAGDSGR